MRGDVSEPRETLVSGEAAVRSWRALLFSRAGNATGLESILAESVSEGSGGGVCRRVRL
jgi:hypothetical protein